MKAIIVLAVITTIISFASGSFGQNCGLNPAVPPGSPTETQLKWDLIGPAWHWAIRYANYKVNPADGPSGSEFEITAAADTWNTSSWNGQGQTGFLFYNLGGTTLKAAFVFQQMFPKTHAQSPK